MDPIIPGSPGSAFALSPNRSKYRDWSEWYMAERAEEHAEILRTSPVECRIGDNVASIPMDDPRALSAWIKASKAPAKRGRKPGSRNAPAPTAPSNLITAVLNLIAAIESRDGEGNVIPSYLIDPVRVALEGV